MKYLQLVSGILFLSLSLSAQWDPAANGIYYNGGKVGIGTSNPQYSLHLLSQGNTGTVSSLMHGQYFGTQVSTEATGSSYYAFNILTGTNSTGGGGISRFYVRGDGNVGIGTTNPSTTLHLHSPSSSTYLNLDKLNSGFEGGIVFSKSGAPIFYLWSDNTDDDALKIETVGQDGEVDATPRMTFPRTNKNIYMAQSGGNVGIGTTTPGNYKLAVEGTIGARKVKVTLDAWADYVFHPTYRLRPLSEVEQYIQQHHHLPEVPSAAEVEKNGLDLGDNQAMLLKKIEELTLYVIEQNKINKEQAEKLEKQQREIDALKKKVQR